jgi:Selenoprotein, putative
MRRAWSNTKHRLARFWQGLREWCGDAAYEKYKQCALRRGQMNVLSPAEFYVEQLNKKYSRPNRCC